MLLVFLFINELYIAFDMLFLQRFYFYESLDFTFYKRLLEGGKHGLRTELRGFERHGCGL